MGWVTGIAVYVIIWFLALFTVLPWRAERSSNPQPGTIESAPDNPRLLLKFGITTVLAALLWLGLDVLIESDLLSFREMAKGLGAPRD